MRRSAISHLSASSLVSKIDCCTKFLKVWGEKAHKCGCINMCNFCPTLIYAQSSAAFWLINLKITQRGLARVHNAICAI